MWKYLLAIVVAAGIIFGSRYFYVHRQELFRPDFERTGGTLLVFEIDGEPPAGGLDDLLDVLQKRFDPGGGEGVVVRVDDEGRVEIGVPSGKQHDDLVESIKRVAPRPGVIEFRIIAHNSDDEAAFTAAMTPVKGEKLDAPPSPPRNATGGGEFPLKSPGGLSSRYRWVLLSEAQLNMRQLDRGGLVHNPFDQPQVENSYRKGVPFAPHFMNHELMQARILPGRTDPAFFILVREPADKENFRVGALENIRVQGLRGRGNGLVQFRLRRGEGERFLDMWSNMGPRTGGAMFQQLLLLLDDEVLGMPMRVGSNRRDMQLYGDFNTTEAEEIVMLMRGGPLPCRLKPKPVREIGMSAKK
jgi:hypothetical protein